MLEAIIYAQYGFVVITILTALVTLAGLVGWVTIDPKYLNYLVVAFLLELVGGIVTVVLTSFQSAEIKVTVQAGKVVERVSLEAALKKEYGEDIGRFEKYISDIPAGGTNNHQADCMSKCLNDKMCKSFDIHVNGACYLNPIFVAPYAEPNYTHVIVEK